MPEVRRDSAAERIGASIARTSVGVSKGAGMAVELARLASNPGRPLTETRSAALYTADDSHGPGGDTDHTFSFDVGFSGLWVAQVDASVSTDAASGFFGVSVSGGAPSGTLGPIPLSGVGDASVFAGCVVNSAFGSLDVLCRVSDAGAPSVEFEVRVTAYRIN